MRRSLVLLSSLGLLSACNASSDPRGVSDTTTDSSETRSDTTTDSSDTGIDTEPDADTSSEDAITQPKVVLGASVPLPGLGAGELLSITTKGTDVFVGTPHGLFRASNPARTLAFEGKRDLGTKAILAVGSLGNDLFVIARDEGLRTSLWRSTSGGDAWMDVTPDTWDATSGLENLALVTHGNHLIVNSGPHRWDSGSQEWTRIDTEVPGAEGPTEAYFDTFGFDGDQLIASAPPGASPEASAYSLDLADPAGTWQRVTPLDSWGYNAFAFAGSASHAVASTATQIFVRDALGWPATFTLPAGDEAPPALDLLVRDGVILAAGANKLRRSTDGLIWEVITETAPRNHHAVFANDDANILRIDRALLWSRDLGATWQHYDNEIAVPTHISVGATGGEGAAFALSADGLFRADHVGDAFGLVVMGDMLERGFSALSATEAWACSAATCKRHHLPTDVLTEVARPPDTDGLASVFATARGVFAMDRGSYAATCGNGVQAPGFRHPSGLFRFNPSTRVWNRASAGLPTRVACDGISGYEAVTGLVEAAGVLFARFDSGTYRSENDGASWTRIDSDDAFIRAAACGSQILALQKNGTLVASADRGETFEPVSTTMTRVSDITAVGQGCVVGTRATDGSATLFTSLDGVSFKAVDAFTEPVSALAADATKLVVATLSAGVLRFDIE